MYTLPASQILLLFLLLLLFSIYVYPCIYLLINGKLTYLLLQDVFYLLAVRINWLFGVFAINYIYICNTCWINKSYCLFMMYCLLYINDVSLNKPSIHKTNIHGNTKLTGNCFKCRWCYCYLNIPQPYVSYWYTTSHHAFLMSFNKLLSDKKSFSGFRMAYIGSLIISVPVEWGRSWVRVKTKTSNLVCVASLLRTQLWMVRAKTCWLGITTMCSSGVTFCFNSLAQ